MLQPIIYLLAFAAVALLAQSVASLLFASSDKKRRINRRLTMIDAGKSRDEILSTLMRKAPAPNTSSAVLIRLHNYAETQIRQAGLSVDPLQLLGGAAGLAGVIWLLGLTLAATKTGPAFVANIFLSAIGACVISFACVWFWISSSRATRIRKIEEQLPLALDIVSRAVRAGHPVISAIQLAADEMSDPVGSEFGLIVDEATYGVELQQALVNFARRTGSPDVHFFAVSVSIQSETGGNLVEILQGLSGTMRGRQTLGKRVSALASEGKASALILSVLPLLMMGVQMVIRPTVYSDKFSDPIFWPVVMITAGLYLGGWLMVRRIINFKY